MKSLLIVLLAGFNLLMAGGIEAQSQISNSGKNIVLEAKNQNKKQIHEKIEKQIIGYLPNWSAYRRNRLVNPKTINYSKYTILDYSFFSPDTNGIITSCDAYADRLLLQGDSNVVTKAHARGVKVMISMGGWSLSQNFSNIAADSTLRTVFANECVRVLKKHDFDGIDIDWEYPTSDRIGGKPSDTQNFTLLLKDIRKAIDSYAKSLGRKMLLTAAMGAAPKHFDKIEWTEVTKLLDYINLMTYATNGVWSERAGHNSPLHGDDTTACISNSVKLLTSKYNVPVEKINVGIAFYGSTLLFPKGKAALGSTEHLHLKDTAGYFEVTKGNPSYFDIKTSEEYFDAYWDSIAVSPYLIDKDSTVFVTYDNARSVTERAKYVNEVGAAGVIVWEITNDFIQDTKSPKLVAETPLADAVHEVFYPEKKVKRPNILFVMTDDHSRHAISAYGSKLIQTPNIDLIAKQGVKFNNCAVTNSICGLSRAVALTGKYSHINGFKDNRSTFDGSQQTFPKLLQEVGYHTMMVGKWHLHSKPQGFDYWNILIGQGDYYTPKMIANGDTLEIPGYVTDVVTDISIEQLAKRDQNKPFCLMYHQKAPHRNWMPNVKHLGLYKGDTLPIPKNFFDAYENRASAAKVQDLEVKNMYMSFDMKLDPNTFQDSTENGTGGSKTWDAVNSWKNSYARMTAEQKKDWDEHYKPISKEFYESSYSDKELAEWKYQRYIKDYLRCIVSVDENLGRMIDYLKETGEWENTLVIYTSDQGFFLGEHGWYDKRFMYEESLITPFLMKVPNKDSSFVNNDLVMNLDFAPTILDYAGIEIPADMQGKSLKPVVEGKTFERKGQYYHYYEYPHGWHSVKKHYGVRSAKYKLIHYYQETSEWEMFDLENDPHEMNNIYNVSKYKKQQKEIHSLLEELRLKYKDTK